ncbi:MAG: aminopeptidase, partial [Chryseolinea sp.]
LDSLYATIQVNDPIDQKKSIKKTVIEKIVMSMDTLSLALTKQPSTRFKDALPNNAYFMNFRTYQSKQVIFWDDFKVNYKSDLRLYIKLLSEKYPFL